MGRRAIFSSAGNFSLDELRTQRERFLPTQVARLGWNGGWDAFLHDVQFRSAKHLLAGDRGLHLAGQVWIVESIRVANELVRPQFQVLAAEGVARAGAEV